VYQVIDAAGGSGGGRVTVSVRYSFLWKTTPIPKTEKWCCYITVDFATTALQNGACTYQCISKQMHYKTSFSHKGYMKSHEFSSVGFLLGYCHLYSIYLQYLQSYFMFLQENCGLNACKRRLLSYSLGW
jgi:hypothetical protein